MRRWIVLVLGLCLAACGQGGSPGVQAALPDTIGVTSSAFAEGAPIPRRFTCAGQDTAPPLAWSGVPRDATQLALVVDDPDAPGGTYVHWVLFRLDPGLSGLDQGRLPPGARQARNSAGEAGYTGPCPPGGPAHHYRFTLYALSQQLDLSDGARLDAALEAIGQAAIAQGRLTGVFAR
ncbi:MAG TPA: YbhB/YbcL family Raf kinase inhibitor-like protein [Actinomycetes bacterium]|jgi:Raf kinase inhibitor-like YbhB/YbcL family protein|nr:YbhB/YbcL family Raf kinase inhibitor-like protein [Actinomycetes bacterium]